MEKGGGKEWKEIEVLDTIIIKCIIISSSYSGQLVLSHPAGGLIVDT